MASAETVPPGAVSPSGEAAPSRRRVLGRIGGTTGAAAASALLAKLGPGATVLGPGTNLVVDADACWRGDTPLVSLTDWQALRFPDALTSIQGAFALAWRDSEGAITLARDPIGERSLLYAETPRGVIFASTLPALLATGLVPRVVHLPAVAAYLTYAYVPGRETLVRGVYKVLPGEAVRFRGSRVERRFWWTLPAEEEEPVPDEEDLRARLRVRLEAAVRRRLSPGRLGATLSGGVDSSLVTALARRLHDGPLATFSVSFGPGYPNELAFSSLVAAHCRTEHHLVEISAADVVRHLDETLGLLIDPIGDPLTVPNALLFQAAAAETGAVLNGEGGDPCFGGPKNLPMILAELLGDGANSDEDSPRARERSYLRAHQKCFDDLPRMLMPEALAALAEAPLENAVSPHFADPRWRSFVTKLMALNVTFKGAHHILPKVDALSAASGVVARSPLFDREVVEMAFAIPPQLKLRGSVEKYLLKRAVEDLLPRVIVERPKSGMLVPVEGWFRGPLLPQAQQRLLDGLPAWGIVRQDYVERLLKGGLPGLRPRRGAKIWLLVTLEAWLRTVLGAP
jgi:asparagine synthase (glutamine-hydrolysing)